MTKSHLEGIEGIDSRNRKKKIKAVVSSTDQSYKNGNYNYI